MSKRKKDYYIRMTEKCFIVGIEDCKECKYYENTECIHEHRYRITSDLKSCMFWANTSLNNF